MIVWWGRWPSVETSSLKILILVAVWQSIMYKHLTVRGDVRGMTAGNIFWVWPVSAFPVSSGPVGSELLNSCYMCCNACVDQEGDDDGHDGSDHNDTEVRNKRQAEQYQYAPTKTRCSLLLVADYRFYQAMGGNNTKTTINYLVSTLLLIICQYVQYICQYVQYIVCTVYICFIGCFRIYGFCRILTERLGFLSWRSFPRIFQFFTVLGITSQHSCAISSVCAFVARPWLPPNCSDDSKFYTTVIGNWSGRPWFDMWWCSLRLLAKLLLDLLWEE
jgi:hypothetical protein